MSLHIQSPETEAELQRQRRIATTMSMMIALLSITLLGIILAFIILPSLSQDSSALITYRADMPEEEQVDQKRMDPQVKRKPSAPTVSYTHLTLPTIYSV